MQESNLSENPDQPLPPAQETSLWSPTSLALVLGVLLGAIAVVFTAEESLFLLFPRLGVRSVELLTSGVTGVLTAIGVAFALRRQARLVEQVNTTSVERQQLEGIKNALLEQTRQLSLTNQDSRQHITQLQQVEASLRASENELRALLAAMTDVFLVFDAEGRYVKIAPTNPKLLVKPVAELVGKTLHEVLPTEQADQLVSYIRRALDTRQTVDADYALTIEGITVWFAAAISPLQEHSVIWVARDISERKRVEIQLAEEQVIATALARVGQELIAVLDTPHILERLCRVTTEVLQCDCSHTLVWSVESDAFVPLAGYGDTPEQWETLRAFQVSRQEVSDLLTRLEQETVIQIDLAQRQYLSPGLQIALQFGSGAVLCLALRRGGEMIGVHTATYRHRPESFPPTSERIALGITHLASLALNNAQLFEGIEGANQLKSDFLATLSHELRTPLHLILGYVDLLQKEYAVSSSPETEELFTRIRRAAWAESEVVNAMLDTSRLEAGKVPLDIQEVNIADLFEELKHEVAYDAEHLNLAFDWQVPVSLVPLWTDRLKLKIVLRNLVQNAIKFTSTGGISVVAEAREEGVEFCVRDTGSGIAPELLPHIFDMFRQGERAMTRHYSGVGLGLYIVRRMVELLGGTVAMESVVGKGSTVRVRIPFRVVEEPSPSVHIRPAVTDQ